MSHRGIILVGLAMLGFSAIPATAQVWLDDTDASASQTPSRLNQQDTLQTDPGRVFGPALSLSAFPDILSNRSEAWAVSTRRDVWHEGENFTDRLSLTTRGELRRADGSPLPLTPLDASALDIDDYDVRFVRGWPVARGYTSSGLEVSLTPHAGIGVGSRGGSAEAGATLRVGGSLGKVVPEGSEAFGERARWYLYAAGSGTAVGYNFARNRDGDFARSGVSHDSGRFLGDASIGVALRKGDMQGSFGIVYREIEAEGLRGGEGFDRDVAEGLVAFQLSIKPEW